MNLFHFVYILSCLWRRVGLCLCCFNWSASKSVFMLSAAVDIWRRNWRRRSMCVRKVCHTFVSMQERSTFSAKFFPNWATGLSYQLDEKRTTADDRSSWSIDTDVSYKLSQVKTINWLRTGVQLHPISHNTRPGEQYCSHSVAFNYFSLYLLLHASNSPVAQILSSTNCRFLVGLGADLTFRIVFFIIFPLTKAQLNYSLQTHSHCTLTPGCIARERRACRHSPRWSLQTEI